MIDDLKAAAERAGLVDMDLLKIVRPELAPDVAMVELRGRFPGAFRTPLPRCDDVRGMSLTDAQAEKKRWLREMAKWEAGERDRRMTNKAMADAAARAAGRGR